MAYKAKKFVKKPSEEALLFAAHYSSPAALAQYTDKDYTRPTHIEYINQKITDAVFEGNKFIIVEAPPRHGKTMLLSRFTPAWFLELFPDKRIILASAGKELATDWGRDIRNLIDQNPDKFTVRLAKDSKASHRFNTEQGGGIFCVGVGGAVSGWGADLCVVDDPFATRQAVQSQVTRNTVWNWWTDSIISRLHPNPVVVVIMQRWHEDDLSGRLQTEQRMNPDDKYAIKWDVINMPAIAVEDDLLGRKPGEPLWPERYDLDALLQRKSNSSAFGWSSQYQQKPTPDGGSVFKREHFRYFTEEEEWYILDRGDEGIKRVLKSRCEFFQVIDTAMKIKTMNDYTACVTMAVTPDMEFLIVDAVRAKLEIPDQFNFIMTQRERFNLQWQGIEDKSSGIGLLQEAKRRGIPIRALKAITDKVDRATPASINMENGRIYFKHHASWLTEYEEELLSFPNGAHDDYVDPTSYLIRSFGRVPGIQII